MNRKGGAEAPSFLLSGGKQPEILRRNKNQRNHKIWEEPGGKLQYMRFYYINCFENIT